MAWGAAFAARADTARYACWRAGTFEPKFGNAIESLAADPRLAAFDNRVGSPGLFGRKPDGVAQETNNKLCRYAHSRAGYTNADIWQSNGAPCSLAARLRSSGRTSATQWHSATCC